MVKRSRLSLTSTLMSSSSSLVFILLMVMVMIMIVSITSGAVTTTTTTGEAEVNASPFDALPEWIKKQRTPWIQSQTSKQIGCKSLAKTEYGRSLDCLESFIEEQLNAFGVVLSGQADSLFPSFSVSGVPSKLKLPQTYRSGWDYSFPVPGYSVDLGYRLSIRADVYDSCLSALFLINRGRIDLAKQIMDTIVQLVDREREADGRLRSSYDIADPIPGISNDDFSRVLDKSVITGDLAYAILALARLYHDTNEYLYLKTALKIANFIEENFKSKSPRGGYTGGFVWNINAKKDTPVFYKSTEHNIALFSAAQMLYALTEDKRWKSMRDHADQFISGMWDDNEGIYMIGTVNQLNDDTVNAVRVSVICQVWKVLSGADNNKNRNVRALQWVLKNAYTVEKQQDEKGVTREYPGIIYARGGSNMQTEVTAATAMALWFISNQRYLIKKDKFANEAKKHASQLLTSLKNIQKYAMNSDGHGMVASVNAEGSLAWPGDERAGETWRYFPLLHTVSTAWTGLAVQYIDLSDAYANPFAAYSKDDISKGGLNYAADPMKSERMTGLSDSKKVIRVSIAALVMALCTITIFFGYLSFIGIQKYLSHRKKYYQEVPSDVQYEDMSQELEMRAQRRIPLPRRLEGLMMSPTPNTPTPATPTI